MLSMDLAAAMEYCGLNFIGGDESKQSPFNEVAKGDQCKILEIYELTKNRSIADYVDEHFPKRYVNDQVVNTELRNAMVSILLMINDPSEDWSAATRTPKREKSPESSAANVGGSRNHFPSAAGSKRGRGGKAKGKSASVPARANRAVDAPEEVITEATTQWCSRELRRRRYKPDFVKRFVSEVDGRKHNAASSKTNSIRLILVPCFDAFGSREELPEMIGANMDVVRLVMAMCILHCDMRALEDLVDKFEGKIRTRVDSGGAEGVAKAFSKAMTHILKIRHGISKNKDTKQCYPVTFDGTDTRLLREDFMLLLGVDLEECKRTRKWPSHYFQALHDALVGLGSGAEKELAALPEYARMALHYSKAMCEARKMPADLRTRENREDVFEHESSHDIFDQESRLYIMAYRQQGWSFKAYGYHLWANMGVLFRKYGSLEGICQQSVEATVGKLSRMLKHLALHPRGAYKKGLSREEQLKELERRQMAWDAPAKVVAEAFLLESLGATYQLFPKDRSTAMRLSESIASIDDSVASSTSIPHEVFATYAYRYMFFESWRSFCRSRSQVRRARAANSNAFADLAAEVNAYYLRGDNEGERKTSWHKQARPKGGVKNGTLVYQRIAYLERPAGARTTYEDAQQQQQQQQQQREEMGEGDDVEEEEEEEEREEEAMDEDEDR
jgi:hypothetical protein